MRPDPRWLAAATFVAGFALRTAPLTQNRFHPDEALYATFARLIASGRDPMLSTVVVDKPPLPFYIMAVSMTAFGGTEFGARLPSLFASALTVALLYKLTRTLYNTDSATIASLALAFSPLAISFAITLFTDNFLAAFLLLVLLLAARRRWTAAGWAFGLAFACKQSALLFLPLLAAIGFVQHSGRRYDASFRDSTSAARTAIISFLRPALLCAAIVFMWDFARSAPISFWTQGYSDNNPGRLVRGNEIWPRWWAWVDLLQYLTGSPVINGLLVVGLPFLLLLNQRSIAAVYDFVLAGFTLSFLAAYWLMAFNVWDRYLLVLAPFGALLCARVLVLIANRLSLVAHRALQPLTRHSSQITSLVTAFCLLLPAILASQSGFPIGGDHGAYDGIDEIAGALKNLPSGSVLYDHWLSWELGFYLFDGPTYLAWMPGPAALADDLRAFGRSSPRYIVAPSWESFTEMQAAIEGAGFAVAIVKQTYRRDGSLSFTLYQIQPPTPNP